jgi:rhodanese-related sulfurtransferase
VAEERARNGSVIVDLRSDDERARDGVIPGSVHVPRSVLEWRVDPDSGFSNPAPPPPRGLPGMGGPDR